jgi:cytochrome c553
VRTFAVMALAAGAALAADPAQEFTQTIRPVLVQNCGACHNPNSRNPANFLKASTAKDMESDRALWRSLATQLRNRTMPPVASKLSEADRLHVSQWVEAQLRQTACSAGDYAGAGSVRRLNRREYRNTVRDLLGVDLDFTSLFPADGTGGAGFDTNGDTLYIPPMLMEKYLQAAQQILDRVIVTPRLVRTFTGPRPAIVAIYVDGDYDIRATLDPKDVAGKFAVKVDGADAGPLAPQRGRGGRGAGPTVAAAIRLERGTHEISIAGDVAPTAWTIEERRPDPSPEKRSVHYRLFGSEPGEDPLQPRKAAQQVIASFLPRAFRRPVTPAEVDRFLALYDRAAERGDPYEERVKLALKAVLVSPDFLFRMEQRSAQPGIHPLGQYELASRLSYFLWSTMPDQKLLDLARQSKLQDPAVLSAEVTRMLDDPRARTFTNSFIGQWLGTQEIGGRFMPILTETLSYYNAAIAADLKLQPVLLFDRIVGENRSILELLNSDYTYLTRHLATYYQMDDQLKDVSDDGFHLVKLPDNRREGLLGMAGILGMTSHYEQTSPVLRGAWVLDTLLGTPVPPPPPDVPPLDTSKSAAKLSTRERVLQHRADPACSACHKLMDPIGFGLENFDWMGRWRDHERDGMPVDATGELPSGEKFNGVAELRDVLLQHKDDFVRQVTAKTLGYALGRSLQDGDSCTVQRLVDGLAHDGFRARTLIRDVVLSLPFRNTQGGVVKAVPIDAPKLNISSVTAKTQDATSHNNGEAPLKK